MESMDRPLALCDLDFTDLNSEDEVDVLAPSCHANGIPPPPPPIAPLPIGGGAPPPPPTGGRPPAPPAVFGVNLKHHAGGGEAAEAEGGDNPSSLQEKLSKKSKKTVKLFWKEVRDDPAVVAKLQKTGISLIWDELSPVSVDTQKLEHLFESRAKDVIPKVTKFGPYL
jgi:FH1/FH2 domain-containing protein 3